MANRLKDLSTNEMAFRTLLLEAILSIQAGDNPRMLQEKLETFLPPAERGQEAPAKAPVDDGEPEMAEAA